MRTSTGAASDQRYLGQIIAQHPELDEPEGDLTWGQWLEGRQRLETALLLGAH